MTRLLAKLFRRLGFELTIPAQGTHPFMADFRGAGGESEPKGTRPHFQPHQRIERRKVHATMHAMRESLGLPPVEIAL